MSDMVATLPIESSTKLDITYKAEEAMTTRYVAIKLGTADDEVLLAADGEQAIGILQNTAAAIGDSVRVRIFGLSPAKCNAGITKGEGVNAAAAGGLIDTVGSGEWAIGVALETAAAQNDIITIFINGPWFYEEG